jgi:hypothetical protein
MRRANDVAMHAMLGLASRRLNAMKRSALALIA